MGCAYSSPTEDDTFQSCDEVDDAALHPINNTKESEPLIAGLSDHLAAPVPSALPNPEVNYPKDLDSANGAYASKKNLVSTQPSSQCGVSWVWLTQFIKKNRGKLVGLTTEQVVEKIIVPATAKKKCRYVDTLDSCKVGPPCYYVAHSWSALFLDTFDHCKQFVSRIGVPSERNSNATQRSSNATRSSTTSLGLNFDDQLDDLYLWFDIFAISQHAQELDVSDLITVDEAIVFSKATLLCLDGEGTALKQAWVLYQIWKTYKFMDPDAHRLKVLYKMSSEAHIARLVKAYWNINLDESMSFKANDKAVIISTITQGGGLKCRFNEDVKQAMVVAMQEEAEHLAFLPDDVYTAEACWKCAVFLHMQAEYKAAEPLYRRAQAICKKILGEDTMHNAMIKHSLAELMKAQGKHGDAERLYIQALAISEKVFGPLHRHTATCLNDLGRMLMSDGRKDEAELALFHAKSIRSRMYENGC